MNTGIESGQDERVALLIPVYNDQKGLEVSLSQLPSEVPLDVIVVDDGSSPPIVLPHLRRPHRGFLLRLEQNQGIEYALNHGLKWIMERNYTFVARLDAGDISLPGRFWKQKKFLEENPAYALVGGQVEFVDDEGREVFPESFPTEYQAILRSLHGRNCFIHSAIMFRTEALKEVGLYSSHYPAAEDYDLFFRMAKRYPVANLEDRVLRYHVNPSGISLQKRRKQLWSRLRILLREFVPQYKESWLGLAKNALLLALPVPLVTRFKRLLKGRRGWL